MDTGTTFITTKEPTWLMRKIGSRCPVKRAPCDRWGIEAGQRVPDYHRGTLPSFIHTGTTAHSGKPEY